MSGIEQALRHNLDVLATGRELARLADSFLHDYPDPWQLAVEQAGVILKKHTGKTLDPRRVWWHEFSGAQSSARSFNGWAHNGRPNRSLPFVQLMIERFAPFFQEASDALDLYGGFYRQGPNAARFDERNEVPLLARDVQKDFWALDFAELYRHQVAAFWARHQDDFRVLAKVNLLAQCISAEQAGRLSAADSDWLRAGISPGLVAGRAPTLGLLQAEASWGARTASALQPGGAAGDCLYLLHAEAGRVLLYLPWADEALHAFDSEQAMAGWLRGQLATPATFEAFLRGMLAAPHDAAALSEMRGALQALADSPDDAATLALLAPGRSTLQQPFFIALAEQAKARMQRDAALMTDNTQLRKAMWRGYLGAFMQVFGGFAPLGWPVTLVLLGVTVAKVGLDIDGAVHARSAEQRKAAMQTAILDSIFAALNMVEVGFGSSFASLSYRVPFHEQGAALGDWQVLESPQAVLADQEANELLEGKPTGSERLAAIRLGPDGACWIELQGLPYRVRYSPELSSWLIVPPDNPFAFGPLRPVRLNGQGEWQLLSPPRLSGGAPGDALPSEPSAFWDEYMKTDLERSAVMSDAARARQLALMQEQQVFELPADQDAAVDEDGFDYADDDGHAEYTYKQDGQYNNHRIFMYTEEEGAKINRFLREGERAFDFGDEVQYVDNLADDLEQLPNNSDVPLYRGGHGVRGTSGTHFRSGRFQVGDVLVNTDLTSFTENPYILRLFAADNDQVAASGVDGVFDDSSVVFELPAGSYRNGTPISIFSSHPNEAETLFLPGSYFRVDGLKEVRGADYHFVHVRLSELAGPSSGPAYDLRTGEVFDKSAYAARLGSQALADRFFAS